MPARDYHDEALQYALRGISGTDWVAFREVARLRVFEGKRVLDVGCGPGRSSRFLRSLGGDVVGVDVSPEMIRQGRALDPEGAYVLIDRDASLPFAEESFNAFFSSWALLEMSERQKVVALLAECRRVVRRGGEGVIVTNTPEFYRGDWVSSDVKFPENRGELKSGQPVRARLLPQGVVVNDYFWTDEDYRGFFESAGLKLLEARRPLGDVTDGLEWKDETPSRRTSCTW